MGIRNTLSTKRQKRIEQMYGFDPFYGEDRSRVRHRTSALNLAMIRRAVVSVAVCWIGKCRSPRGATLRGFFDFMSAQQSKKAFSLVTVSKSSWLPPL